MSLNDCKVTVVLTKAPVVALKVVAAPVVDVSVSTPVTKIITIPVGPQGPPGPQGIPGSASLPPELELFLAWELANNSNFKTFTYSLGVLTDIDIYTDNTLTTQLFNKSFTYSLGVLTTVVITRIADSATETRSFVYSLGVLQSIDTVQA